MCVSCAHCGLARGGRARQWRKFCACLISVNFRLIVRDALSIDSDTPRGKYSLRAASCEHARFSPILLFYLTRAVGWLTSSLSVATQVRQRAGMLSESGLLS